MCGRRFELVGYAHSWGEHRVFFRKPDQERVCSLPASFTDVEGSDPYLMIAAGRAHFRSEDLLALVRLLDELEAREE